MYRKLLLFLVLMAATSLFAQKPDTLYIYETVIEHDTLISRDTTWVHDTVFLHKPAVPNDTPKTTSPSYYPEYQEKEEEEQGKGRGRRRRIVIIMQAFHFNISVFSFLQLYHL